MKVFIKRLKVLFLYYIEANFCEVLQIKFCQTILSISVFRAPLLSSQSITIMHILAGDALQSQESTLGHSGHTTADMAWPDWLKPQ